MSVPRRFFLLWAAMGLLWHVGPAAGVLLVKEGKPQATIIVTKAALKPAKTDLPAQKAAMAAHDLQEYVRKMSGAELAIAGDDASPAGTWVLVGRSALADVLGADIPAGLTSARREEGFVILARDNRLLLAGNDAGPYHGTEYAVYELLERLGVRWFMPGDFGEVVPALPDIEVADETIRQKPDFIQRNWWLHTTPEMAALEARWKIRNKMNPDPMFAMPGDGSSRNFVADKTRAATEPDLLARNPDGSVNAGLANLSNPEAVRIAADKMKEMFGKHPEMGSVGIAPDDGLPRDFSPDTVKRNQGFVDLLGREGVDKELSTSEEWIEFVSAVARQVKQEFPDRIITTNGYANRNLPPEGVTLDPNLSIMFAAIWSDTLHAYDDPKSWQMVRQGQMLRRWCGLSDKVWVYGYNYTNLTSALTPAPITRKLARDFPLLKEWGVVGFNDEARNQWAECGITTKYVRARLEWNADTNVDSLLDDYFARWYGAAAKPARQFWDAIEQAIEQTPYLGHDDRIMPYVYTPAMMRACDVALREAETSAASERDRLHVRTDRLIYEHLKDYLAMSSAEWAGDFTGAAKHADEMMQRRKALYAINPFFMLDNEKRYDAGIWYWGVLERAAYYRKLADLTGDKTGGLVALLPEETAFRTDPNDEGRFAGWQEPKWDATGWQRIKTTQPFYSQGYLSPEGYPYTGYMWYRFEVDIPAGIAEKPIAFYAPVVETEAWLWVNGRYIGHRPYREAYERPAEMDCDVTAAIKPGQRNVIAMRVSTGLARAQAAEGLCSRLFLYSPKAAGSPATK